MADKENSKQNGGNQDSTSDTQNFQSQNDKPKPDPAPVGRIKKGLKPDAELRDEEIFTETDKQKEEANEKE